MAELRASYQPQAVHHVADPETQVDPVELAGRLPVMTAAQEADAGDLRQRLQALYARAEARGDRVVQLRALGLLAQLRALEAATGGEVRP
jgi:hypothetical protein